MLCSHFLSNFQIENVDGKAIYSGIIQVTKFISKCICLQNGSWVRCFGRLTWPRISELIISNFLSKVSLFNFELGLPSFTFSGLFILNLSQNYILSLDSGCSG